MSSNDFSVELHERWLRVALDKSAHADFHYRWLRHNCDVDRHPTTRERTVCSSDLPDDIRARRAFVNDGALVVEWAHDGRKSEYPLGWLAEHAYARNRAPVPAPPTDVAPHELRAGARLDDTIVAAAIAHVRTHGLVVVRREGASAAPPEDETEPLVERFVSSGLHVRGTHFGRIEDLRTDNVTNQNTDQLGYTDAGIELHTDQPFLDDPPRYQLLQCVRKAARGGDNFVADARAAYRYLASIDARAAEILRTVPLRFHRKQAAFERLVVAPVVARTDDDAFFVRSSYFTLAPHAFPFDEVEEVYRAHDTFVRLVRSHRYELSLEAGEFLLYDNHRMLHGRSAFEGARWVRGIYFDEHAAAG